MLVLRIAHTPLLEEGWHVLLESLLEGLLIGSMNKMVLTVHM